MLRFQGRSNDGRFRSALNVVALMAALISLVAFSGAAFSLDTKLAQGKRGKMTNDPVVVMETTKGTIKIQVFKNEAPITAGNFLDLVGKGFYNGLTFHRYEPNFVIQGGDPKGTGMGGYIDPQTGRERTIPLEKKPNLRHDSAGIVAMARSDNPNSASSQFYITLAPATFLDNPPGYAVFGKVIDGLNAALALRQGDKMTKVSMLEPANK
ncbi:MAG TPA: peptidylprolyl isomerase [Candidatus Obscuribacterales bacterium]